jgi:hypothetical protein
MAQIDLDRLSAGPELDALVAERVFGWKDVKRHSRSESDYRGKKQDKAGRWRLARVPPYSIDPVLAYQIEERMKELNLLVRYQKELSKISRAKGLPADWASPDQRCRAALKTVKSGHTLRLVKR